jgi:oligopeptide transport system ATP-binding protein
MSLPFDSGFAMSEPSSVATGTPQSPRPASEPSRPPLLEVTDLTRYFRSSAGWFGRGRLVHAVEDVTLSIAPGETLGLVGESGCGKSTLGRTILRLIEPTRGRIHLQGTDITHLPQAELRRMRRQMQVIFQDPYSSLDPRMTIREIVAEPLRIHRLCTSRDSETASVSQLLERVGLKADALERYPHEFSGGQRQRIGVARALAVQPAFIVCDEPLSSLDVSIQAQIVNLLLDLRESLGVGYLFISHDLEVVRYVSHRIAVMYLGRIVEIGPTRSLTERRLHPYTSALLSAVPVAEPGYKRRRLLLHGDVPSPLCPPTGCPFHPRCPRAIAGTCDAAVPMLREVDPGSDHRVACYFPGD